MASLHIGEIKRKLILSVLVEPKPYRPPQDLAYGLVRWIANGGSHFNYYMYFGGTNWARSTGTLDYFTFFILVYLFINYYLFSGTGLSC